MSQLDTGTIAMTPVDIVYVTTVTMSTEPATMDVKMDMRETCAKNVCYIISPKLMRFKKSYAFIICTLDHLFY